MTLRRLILSATLISLATPLAAFPQAPLGEQLEEFAPALVFVIRDSKISDSHSRGMKELMYSWYMIQDSTMQLVWHEPSGMKESGKGLLGSNSGPRYFDADLDMLALSDVRAFELHIMIFDIWREHLRTFAFARITGFRRGEDRSFDPRRIDPWDDLLTYATSLIWIDRVLLADGQILQADPAVVLAVAQKIGSDVTAADLFVERVPEQRESRGR